MKNQTIVSFSHTKHRNAFGMVGIEVDATKKIAFVRLVKEWSREEFNKMPSDVAQIYKKIQWSTTYADQLMGHALIRSLEHAGEFRIHTITTQKNLKDPKDIEKIKVMDQIEMTQLLLSLKQDHKIQFPPQPTVEMSKLIHQFEMFSEHSTEQGNMSYYAPGKELDNLTRSLMICCFAARHSLQQGDLPFFIQRGVNSPPKPKTPEEKMFGELFYGSPHSNRIKNNLDIVDAYRKRNFR